MRIQQGTHQILGNGHPRRENYNGFSKGKRITRMADTLYSEASTVFLRLWKFLQEIYQEIL